MFFQVLARDPYPVPSPSLTNLAIEEQMSSMFQVEPMLTATSTDPSHEALTNPLYTQVFIWDLSW